jgi:branched-chain amino acid transport system permease protein
MISAFIFHILIIICIYFILAMSLQLALGYGGLLNLGHVAFYSIGAYVSTILTLKGLPFLPSFFLGGITAMISGLLLSLPTNKLKGDYLALVTLGFTFVVNAIALNWVSVTRGSLGLFGIPKPIIFGFEFNDNIFFFGLVVFVTLVSFFVIRRIIHSDFGKVVQAVRDNELAAMVLGKNSFKVKNVNMMASAFFAGLAGSLYAHYITYIDPGSFSTAQLIPILCIVIIGGLASLRGTFLATIALILLPELLRFVDLPSFLIGPVRQSLYAFGLLFILMYKPRGLFGKVDLD